MAAAASASGGGGGGGGGFSSRTMDNYAGDAASARMNAPSADRNKQFILDELLKVLPAEGSTKQDGRVLEIASGTGQHVSHFAAATPWLTWMPSDLPTSEGFDSIRAW